MWTCISRKVFRVLNPPGAFGSKSYTLVFERISDLYLLRVCRFSMIIVTRHLDGEDKGTC